jgi:hypothetical protein
MYAIVGGGPEFAPFTYFETMAECKEKEVALMALAEKVHLRVRTGCYVLEPPPKAK